MQLIEILKQQIIETEKELDYLENKADPWMQWTKTRTLEVRAERKLLEKLLMKCAETHTPTPRSIEQEAEGKYPYRILTDKFITDMQRAAYIAGRTSPISTEQANEAFHRVLQWYVEGMKQKSSTAFTSGLERTMAVLVETVLLDIAGRKAGEGYCQWVKVVSENDLPPEGEYLYEWKYSKVWDNLSHKRMFKTGAAAVLGVGGRDMRYLSESINK